MGRKIVILINKWRQLRKKLLRFWSTFFTYLLCKLYGVKLAAGIGFWKRPVIYRELDSVIMIGEKCVFRSDLDSNLLGGNKRCILSTHAANAEIRIGQQCAFTGVTIGAMKQVVLGDQVLVGVNSIITDFDWHSMDPYDRDNKQKMIAKPVVIGDHVWIGANCTILKGVTIGKNTIVGSGSVVTKDLPANAICAGNPCRIIRYCS
ncbi:MAG: acyltransferase [Sphingobacteriales bacterium]|nr:acyltransferase [Sphingobacteriales bacterium]